MPRADDVRTMFDRIAGRYDLMNRLMTAGIDQRWRAQAVRVALWKRDAEVLDVCCGTGDIAFALAEHGAARVVGVDFSPKMLQQARGRHANAPAAFAHAVEFREGDALDLPFDDDSFDSVTVGFGVRNVEDLQQAFTEFARVVRQGGRVVCLEITQPRNAFFSRFYSLWFDRLVPLLGGIIAGDRSAYTYLPESVRGFPPADELKAIMGDVGLRRVQYRLLAGGIVALHCGTVGDGHAETHAPSRAGTTGREPATV